MNHIDLFSGIGGFAYAAKQVGIETVQFVEIDSYCQKVLAKNFPGVPIHGDIKTFEWTGDKPFLLTGGFPCQDLSSAGYRKGIHAKRSGLWGELYNQMCNLRPKFTIIENVTGLLTGDDGRWFKRLLLDMAQGGFNVEWECVPASSIGAPHHRDRVYIIAYPSENGWLRIFSKTNFKIRRNLGNNNGIDWFGCGEGAWSDWQTKTREEIFAQPIIARKNDGVPRWMDRDSSLGNSIIPQIAMEIMRAIKAND